MKKFWFVILVLSGVLFTFLWTTTGFLRTNAIDNLDKEKWTYINGVIPQAEGFSLSGDSGECWVMVHGYTSTPDELRILAETVHDQFDDSVYVPRLYGHGELPSHIEQHSVETWYSQIEHTMIEKNCSHILGSSLGASIALRYAEEHPVKGAVFFGILLKQTPRYLPMESVMRFLTPIVRYTTKDEPGATVDSPVGKKLHISTYAFPLKGAVELADFNGKVIDSLGEVSADVLFVHAVHDTVADIVGAEEAYNNIRKDDHGNPRKEFVRLENGDHIIMRDYDKEKALAAVVEFRRKVGTTFT